MVMEAAIKDDSTIVIEVILKYNFGNWLIRLFIVYISTKKSTMINEWI